MNGIGCRPGSQFLTGPRWTDHLPPLKPITAKARQYKLPVPRPRAWHRRARVEICMLAINVSAFLFSAKASSYFLMTPK